MARTTALPLLALLLALAVAPAAAAQAQDVLIELEPAADLPRVAVEPGSTVIPIPWTVTFANSVAASAALADGGARLTWKLTCPDAITLQTAETPVPLVSQPQDNSVSGIAELGVQASAGAVGMEGIPCVLEATFSDSRGMASGAGEARVLLVAEYVDGLVAKAPEPRMGGPQRQVPFPIELSNGGNSRTRVSFELQEDLPGHWNALVPEAVVLEPGEGATAVLTVATPFDMGYNSHGASFLLRVLPAADADPGVKGPPQEVEVRASSKGWYVPGPSPLVALAALALGAALLRRQRP